MHKTTYFIDSNVFVYAKIGDKKYGKCSQEIIKAIYKGKIEAIIDTVVLLEVANALRKLKVKDVEEEILAILTNTSSGSDERRYYTSSQRRRPVPL
ncbi:MAG: PIN domain-containing protein [Acidianus infernus]|nr:PIN domain-containing protein [Acidianus infernus]